MKKSLATLLILVVMIFALAVSAAAANYENLADELNALGLFKGSESGYELDRQPRRSEALVMLIRLLGLEEEALASEYDNPFTDVPEWLAPYVTYAFENGLTSGTTDTTFSPDNVCTAQMYVTFVLRALGYDDAAGDFTYADSLSFGTGVGIVDIMLTNGDFLRDQMVAISYLALAAEPQNAEFNTLLEKLTDAGAVDEAAAASVAESFDIFDEFMQISAAMENEKKIAMTANIDVDLSVMGQQMPMAMTMDMSMIMEDTDITAAVEMLITAGGEEIAYDCYIANGYVYASAMGEKAKMEYPIADILAMAEDSQATSDMRYLIDSISKSTEGDSTVYTLVYSQNFFNTVMEMAMAMSGDITGMAMPAIEVNDFTIKVYADKDGTMSKVAMTFDMTINVEMEGSTMAVSAKADAEFEITATGDDVTVKLPDDLDEYQDMGQMEMPVAAA